MTQHILYSCVCKDGYQLSPNGITCEDVDECKDNSNNCDHYCSNTVGGFSCSCRSGYYLSSNGSSCINRNECELELTNQCDPLNGNCTDITDPEDGQLGYLCGCNSGYVLSEDGFTCNDLNECSLEDRGGCSQGCSNSKGSYTCYCGNGYALNTTDMMSCDDINECSSSATHNCYSDRFCTNTDGGYTCSCPDDFYLKSDGFTCVSLDTCKSGHSCSDTCSVINGTDTCQCSRGYLLAADNKTCQDVNECTEGLNICDSKYNVKCVNDEPGYHCACISDKYTQIEEAKCIDVDECSTGEAVCRDNSYCTNKENGYSCPCLTGFTDNVAGGCSDIKECLTGDNACHKTLATCTDFDGGYSCECKPGYTGDGVECTDINECAKTHSCDPNPDAGVCTNTPGSYSCSCRPGYEIQTSNLCLNIDECSNVVKYGVECSQVCIDTPGSVKCGCTDGYKLSADGLNCSPQVACSNKTICAHNCLKRNGVDTCTCNPGYSLDSADNSTCIDIDECATNTSSCDKNLGVCENVEGSYTCSCLNDFTVGPNGECEDRDGGFGEWSLFSNCTETCGEEGVQTRSRTCDSPSPEGKGAKCQGEDTESQPCNRILCEDQLEYGVQMELHGVTNTLFEVAEDVFTQKLATQINSYCISDSAAAQECCGVTFSLMSPENKTFLTYSDLEVSSRDIVDINGTVVVVTAEVDVTTNEVCTAISSGSRRKREISFVSQQLLLSILSDESFITEIVSVVETTLSHYNVTITNSPVFTSSKQVTLAPTTGSTTSDQATPTSTPSTANSTPAWVIAVSVVCGLLVVVAVAVAVVLLIKRPRKVSDGGNGHEVEANQNQANNHLTMPS
ncbi:hypothetical protein EB796_025191 [Bugula neritina]|uniref:EGF-like domain-containing protein n=1 Tax=Bugula neritina TaxID=10212 RepID=A0A7J7IRP7_BUGNE|nr:hypothetical protein EB796_025191 [Bugula neritina]